MFQQRFRLIASRRPPSDETGSDCFGHQCPDIRNSFQWPPSCNPRTCHRGFGLSLSLVILDELRNVLERPKFRFSPEQAFQVIEELHAVCDIVNPAIQVNIVTADPKDNMILECAMESKAEIIVSGDQHLLAIVEFRGIQIVSPFGYRMLSLDHLDNSHEWPPQLSPERDGTHGHHQQDQQDMVFLDVHRHYCTSL